MRFARARRYKQRRNIDKSNRNSSTPNRPIAIEQREQKQGERGRVGSRSVFVVWLLIPYIILANGVCSTDSRGDYFFKGVKNRRDHCHRRLPPPSPTPPPRPPPSLHLATHSPPQLASPLGHPPCPPHLVSPLGLQ